MPVASLRAVIVGAAMLLCVAAGTAPARAPGFAALAGLERGRWALDDGSGNPRSLCLGDPAVLLQLHHPGAGCTRFLLEDTPRRLVVHYSCDNGHGRTTVRVDTPRALHLETLGVSDGLPFDDALVARRTGRC